MKRNLIVSAALVVTTMFGASACTSLDSSGPHAFTSKNQHAKNDAGSGGNNTNPKPKPKPDPMAGLTEAQKQAVGSAQDYLNYQAFSRLGLIKQLSSKYGEGFKEKDAIFAVNHIQVDWNKEAVKSAKEYLSTQHFSRAGLIGQLSSKFGEQFTKAQAIYAANHVGL